jgi:hypothetical protein
MNAAEITDKLGLHSLRNRNWYIQATCATSGDGLYEGLDWLSNQLKNAKWTSIATADRSQTSSTLSLRSSYFLLCLFANIFQQVSSIFKHAYHNINSSFLSMDMARYLAFYLFIVLLRCPRPKIDDDHFKCPLFVSCLLLFLLLFFCTVCCYLKVLFIGILVF